MNFKRLLAATVGLLFALTVNLQSAPTTQKADVVSAVNQFFSNLSDKTLDKAIAVCDSPVAILDEFPPHVWYGPSACKDWWQAYKAYNAHSGIKSEAATLGDPWSVDISGDRAYFVAPSTYTYMQNGKTIKEAHAVFTVALRRSETGWRITSWTWSKH
jgi:ketosteroid isomerase-like protein